MNDICPVYKSWGKHPEHHDRLHARLSSLEAENERLERDCLHTIARAESAEKKVSSLEAEIDGLRADIKAFLASLEKNP